MPVLFRITASLTLLSLILLFISHQYSHAGPTVKVGPSVWVSLGGGRIWLHNAPHPYQGSILHVVGDPDPPHVTGGDFPGVYLRVITHRSNPAWWTLACSPLYFLIPFTILALIARPDHLRALESTRTRHATHVTHRLEHPDQEIINAIQCAN